LNTRIYFIFIAIASGLLIFAVVNMTLGDMEKAKKQEELDRLTEARDQAFRDLDLARANYNQAVEDFNNRGYTSQGIESISDMLPTKEELENMPSISEKIRTKEELKIRP